MAGTGQVYVVRHAEGLHNIPLPNGNPNIRDPDLTDKGKRQAKELETTFSANEDISKIAVVLTSPLTRAIRTSLIAFSDILDKRYYANEGTGGEGGVENGVSLVLDPYLQEGGSEPANKGSSLSRLKETFPLLDYGTMTETWYRKVGDFAPTSDRIKARLLHVRNSLAERLEELESTDKPNIIIVSHGGFIFDLTEAELEQTEYRAFVIRKGEEGSDGRVLVPATGDSST